MTTLDRDSVFALRSSLVQDSAENKESLDIIDKSLFVLTLDDNQDNDINTLSQVALTGKDGHSRWFDKHNVVVDKNGTFFHLLCCTSTKSLF